MSRRNQPQGEYVEANASPEWRCTCGLTLPRWSAKTADGYLLCVGCKSLWNEDGTLAGSTHDPVSEAIEKGDTVLICDGTRTGKVGIVGGRKGTSVAVCIEGQDSHDCDGMCPQGGVYEPDYALLRFSSKDARAVDLLVSHLTDAYRIAALSYARGVEDSARIVENERQNTPDLVESRTLSRAASAIRSLTRNTTHPCTCGNRGYTALVENKHFPDCPAVPITPHKDTV